MSSASPSILVIVLVAVLLKLGACRITSNFCKVSIDRPSKKCALLDRQIRIVVFFTKTLKILYKNTCKLLYFTYLIYSCIFQEQEEGGKKEHQKMCLILQHAYFLQYVVLHLLKADESFAEE
jgi:hypothetical protein